MKTLRILLSAVMLVALFAGMQVTAYATVVSPANDEVSRIAENDTGILTTDEVARTTDEASRISDEFSLPENTPMPTEKDIYPISANPDTGANNLAIPAVVALLAASAAAITLTSKKK